MPFRTSEHHENGIKRRSSFETARLLHYFMGRSGCIVPALLTLVWMLLVFLEVPMDLHRLFRVRPIAEFPSAVALTHTLYYGLLHRD